MGLVPKPASVSENYRETNSGVMQRKTSNQLSRNLWGKWRQVPLPQGLIPKLTLVQYTVNEILD